MTREAHPHLALALIAAASLAGCFEPIQSGGVVIIGDPSERMGTLCRFRQRASGSDPFCAADAPASAPVTARVRRMKSAAEGLRGPHASGRAGDYLLENDEIAVVVSDLPSHDASLASGGHIIDAGSTRDRVDALGWMAAALGSQGAQPAYAAIASGIEKDGSAWVEVRGRELGGHGPALRAATRYTLTPGARTVTVATTLQNEGAGGPVMLDLGDVVCWGGATVEAPGPHAPPAEDAGARRTSSPYLFGVGDGVAYAVAADGQPFSAGHAGNCSSITFRSGVEIADGAPVTYERLFVVAPRGDTVAVASELFFLAGGTPGGVELGVVWDAVPSAHRGGARVLFERLADAGAGAGAAPFPDPRSLWIAAPMDGSLTAELPPGRYAAKLEGAGVIAPEAVAVVVPGKVTRLDLIASVFDGAPQIPQKE